MVVKPRASYKQVLYYWGGPASDLWSTNVNTKPRAWVVVQRVVFVLHVAYPGLIPDILHSTTDHQPGVSVEPGANLSTTRLAQKTKIKTKQKTQSQKYKKHQNKTEQKKPKDTMYKFYVKR